VTITPALQQANNDGDDATSKTCFFLELRKQVWEGIRRKANQILEGSC
jgi:hypothetical protein